MGGLVQQPAPARADRKHPTRRGRSPLPRARRDPIFGRVTQANLPPANSVRFKPERLRRAGLVHKVHAQLTDIKDQTSARETLSSALSLRSEIKREEDSSMSVGGRENPS